MITIKLDGELLNYDYLQIPQCIRCNTYISQCSNLLSQNRWQCHICGKTLKLPQWYQEKPIQYDNFKLQQASPFFTKKIVFLIDVTSNILCQMIIPLIEQNLSNFDEIALIPCTPYPTIIELEPKKRMITLTSNEQLEKINIFLNCQREFKKIKIILRMIENLSQYNQVNVLKNNNPIEKAQQFINRLQCFEYIKIIHFTWINFFNLDFCKQEIFIGKNHYQLFVIEETKNIQDSYKITLQYLHGICEVYSNQDLESWYNRIESLLNNQFSWEAIVQVNLEEGWRVKKFQNQMVESNIFYQPFLSEIDDINLEITYQGKKCVQSTTVQCIVTYKDNEKKFTIVKNIIVD